MRTLARTPAYLRDERRHTNPERDRRGGRPPAAVTRIPTQAAPEDTPGVLARRRHWLATLDQDHRDACTDPNCPIRAKSARRTGRAPQPRRGLVTA